MKKLSKLDFTDFYYCAEQKFVSLVTSLFKNPVLGGKVRVIRHALTLVGRTPIPRGIRARNGVKENVSHFA